MWSISMMSGNPMPQWLQFSVIIVLAGLPAAGCSPDTVSTNTGGSGAQSCVKNPVTQQCLAPSAAAAGTSSMPGMLASAGTTAIGTSPAAAPTMPPPIIGTGPTAG